MSELVEKQDVVSFLGDLIGEEVFYCPNPGNAGDALIAEATYQLFDEIGLSYQVVWPTENMDLAGKIVLYGGGGSLVSKYEPARRFIERYHSSVRLLVLLPHTVEGHEDLLQQFGENVVVFCREHVSYAHVRKYASKATVLLADDLAFGLDVDRVLREGEGWRHPRFWWNALFKYNRKPRRIARIAWNLFQHRPARKGVLNAFRTDAEKTNYPVPEDNLDITGLLILGTRHRYLVRAASFMMLDFINRYEEVNTNRLHVCIASLLLGKRVNFYPNNYWKCKAVYEATIRNRYSRVKWMGD
ncbi:MAG: hypothetical protein D6816_15815 [Bacteroidetes bacterium]|nr:MAG: hypothetical protein D6816_15815 [Bacteroidota bacterium]